MERLFLINSRPRGPGPGFARTPAAEYGTLSSVPKPPGTPDTPDAHQNMPRLLQPLWLLLASVTDRQLARMVEYLKAENCILRDKLPAQVKVTPRERSRLVRLGSKLGTAVRDLITIVTPRTFARWVAGEPATRVVLTGTSRDQSSK